LKEEALDRPLWGSRFGWVYGPVVRQTAKWMKGRHFPLSQRSRRLWSPQRPVQWVRDCSLWSPRRHSLPSTAQIKTKQIYSCTFAPVHVFILWRMIMFGDKFYVTGHSRKYWDNNLKWATAEFFHITFKSPCTCILQFNSL
jgi:hypothetical protein